MSKKVKHRIIMAVIVVAVCIGLWLVVGMTDRMNNNTLTNTQKSYEQGLKEGQRIADEIDRKGK